MGDRHTRDVFAPATRDPESEREYSRRADPGPPQWQPGARILVGTSGYRFPDWVGPFYPPGLKSADMLSFYSERFPAVEVNSTYYRVPPPRVTARMAEKTPPAFRFVVKAPQSLTHERRLDLAEMAAFRACLDPLQAADKLDGVLLQFPWSFRPEPTSRRFLAGTRAIGVLSYVRSQPQVGMLLQPGRVFRAVPFARVVGGKHVGQSKVGGRAFTYALRREAMNRRFRVECDLTKPVEAPPARWGYGD